MAPRSDRLSAWRGPGWVRWKGSGTADEWLQVLAEPERPASWRVLWRLLVVRPWWVKPLVWAYVLRRLWRHPPARGYRR